MNNKKYIAVFFISVFLSGLSSLAQTVVQMEYSDGVYKIPCHVNGARMKFILDTGATNVCLSIDMAEYLYENDYITLDDFYDFGQSQVADGSIVDHLKLNINDMEIGGIHLKNVESVVIASQSAPLLMGQSALKKFGSYTIKGDKLIINNDKNDKKGTGERSKLIETAKESMKKGFYALAISSFVKARELYELDYVSLEHLAWCYKYENNFKDCFEVCKKWLQLYEHLNYQSFNSSIYELCWRCNYYYGYYEQALLFKQKRMFTRNADASKLALAWDQENLGEIYLKLKRYENAISSYKTAIDIIRQDKNLKEEFPTIKDDDLLSSSYFDLCRCYRAQKNKKEYKKYLELAKKCGNKNAIMIANDKKEIEKYYNTGKI